MNTIIMVLTRICFYLLSKLSIIQLRRNLKKYEREPVEEMPGFEEMKQRALAFSVDRQIDVGWLEYNEELHPFHVKQSYFQ